MVIVLVVYPNKKAIIRRLVPTQAQMIINNSIQIGALVAILYNPTDIVLETCSMRELATFLESMPEGDINA